MEKESEVKKRNWNEPQARKSI